LKAQISAGTYTTPNYIWQKSTDGGNTWIDLTLATTIMLLIFPQVRIKIMIYIDLL
jgi:hypothetical protein